MEVLRSVELSKKVYDKLLNEVAKGNGLTLNEIKILMFLDKNVNDNIAKNIVEGLGYTKSHISMSVCNLEQLGYIKKVQDEKDKKKCHLKLTDKSQVVINNGKKVQSKLKEIMFEGITKEEVDILSIVSKKMKNNLENYNKD